MNNADEDVIELLGYAGQRLLERMVGLTDDEWAWQPISGDAQVTIRWRLDHIASVLAEERNWLWLGAHGTDAPQFEAAASTADALAAVDAALRAFTALTASATANLESAIGEIAGAYGEASRRSLVLHIADELIHHGAEAALLRDLYAGRTTL